MTNCGINIEQQQKVQSFVHYSMICSVACHSERSEESPIIIGVMIFKKK
jgi:hypothetical protein